jgi:glutamate synthase (NADPH/NADH) small chain
MKKKTRVETWEREIDRRARLRIPAPRLDYRPAEERIKDFEEACLGFSLDTAREEASRCVECPEPQGCVLACPLHNDIPTVMWEVSQGNFLEAAAILRETSNFPELCGRLCPDECLCAGSCGVGKFHPDVRLGRLEAFVADYQREVEGGIPIPEILPPTGKRVAVVGSGPAGLTAAEELSKLGHKVTVFEMRERPGGTLIYDIPRFRLPLNVVDDKVTQLESMGVEFIFETCVGRDSSVDDLFQQGYHAVFLGTGAGLEAVMDLSCTDLDGIYQATEFLKYTNLYDANIPPDAKVPRPKDKQVVIFGGGYAAVDCARTAVRMGAQEVTCFYRCGELDTLCRIEDKIAAQEEGVYFVPLVEAASLIGDEKGRVVQAQCQRMRPSGIGPQAQTIPVEGATYMVDADLVILAPERGPDPLIGDTTPGLQTESEGWVLADKETGQTTRRGVFAAGDNTGQSQLAVVAIAEARKGAAAIHEYLSG